MKKVDAKTKTEKLGLTHHNLHWWVAGRMVWRRLQLGRLGQAGPFWGRPGNLCVEVRSVNIGMNGYFRYVSHDLCGESKSQLHNGTTLWESGHLAMTRFLHVYDPFINMSKSVRFAIVIKGRNSTHKYIRLPK